MIERGALKAYAWRRPDPRGWFFSAPEPYPGFTHTHAAHYRRLQEFMDDAIAERRQWQAG